MSRVRGYSAKGCRYHERASSLADALGTVTTMSMGKGLRFRGFVVPESELEWSFDPSGGPGGQHANRASSRARVTFDLGTSVAFPEAIRDTIVMRLCGRARQGVVTIAVDDTRSQWRNRAIARQRLVELIETALVPQQERRRTRPSASARRRRLDQKRQRAETKRLRQRPNSED